MIKEHNISCDIAVMGGGPAGVAAAVTAARMGKRVLLAERNGYLGGSLALGLSPLSFLDKQGRRCVSGFGWELMKRLEQTGDCLGTDVCPKHNSVTAVNPDGVKILCAQLCRESGVQVLLHCEPLEVSVENGRIASVTLYGKGNRVGVTARQWIDCTGDGDLAALSGCSWEMGQEDTHVLQPPTVMFTLQQVDEEKLLRYVDEHPEELRYNDRNIYENPDYTPDHFRAHPSHVFVGLQSSFRHWKAEGKLPVERESYIHISGTHPGEVYVNTTRLLHTDATDLLSLSAAELEGTLQIPKLIALLKENIPGFEHCYLSAIAPSLGVRETRRFRGVRRVTGQDALSGYVPPDSICLCGYKIDIHSGTDTGLLFRDIQEPFGIPYGCLVSAERDNLLFAGRCISCDPIAYGALRIITFCLAMGQAAAVGACVSLDNQASPREADVDKIRAILLSQGAILSMGG